MTIYNADYFIAKFEAIPEEQWCTRAFTNILNQHCAFGHCGKTYTNYFHKVPEAAALFDLFADVGKNGLSAAAVNDGEVPEYPQTSPKQRILAALRDIKAGQR